MPAGRRPDKSQGYGKFLQLESSLLQVHIQHHCKACNYLLDLSRGVGCVYAKCLHRRRRSSKF